MLLPTAVRPAGLLAIALAAGCADGGALDFTKKVVALPTGIEMKYVEVGNPEGGEVARRRHSRF